MQLDMAKVRFNKDLKLNSNARSGRVSIFSQDLRNEYPNIKIDKLISFEDQARRIFDPEKLNLLAESIKTYGLRHPLTVRPSTTQEGFYEVVGGERRLRALAMLGVERVPCFVLPIDSKAQEIALIENIHREDLHPIELMYGYSALLDKKICTTQQELADLIKQSKATVSEVMSLKSLDITVQDYLIENAIISRKVLRTLVKLPYNEQKVYISNLKKGQEVTEVIKDKKTRGLKQKSNVLQIILKEGTFEIEKNSVNKLSVVQKTQLKELLQNII